MTRYGRLDVSLERSRHQAFEISGGVHFGDAINQSDLSGKTIFERRIEFRELSEMNFRLLVGDDGLVPIPTVHPGRGIERRRTSISVA